MQEKWIQIHMPHSHPSAHLRDPTLFPDGYLLKTKIILDVLSDHSFLFILTETLFLILAIKGLFFFFCR